MSVAISPDDPYLTDFVFDLTISEEHSIEILKSTAPVEAGAEVSDHIVRKPDRFACVVFMTNTPIERTPDGNQAYLPFVIQAPGRPPYSTPSLFNLFSPDAGSPPQSAVLNALAEILPRDRVRTMVERLEGLAAMRKPVTVFTTRKTYRDMILMTVSAPVTVENGELSVEISLSFEQLRTVSSSTVAAPKPKTPNGQKQSTQGKKDPKEPDTGPTVKRSTFDKVIGFVGNLISGGG